MIDKALEEAVRKAGPPTRFNREEYRQAVKLISTAIVVGDLVVLAALLALRVKTLILIVVGAILAVDSLIAVPLVASSITRTLAHYLKLVAEFRPDAWCITGRLAPALTMSFGDCIVHVKRNLVVYGRVGASASPYKVLDDMFVFKSSIAITVLYCIVLAMSALVGYEEGLERVLALSTLLYFLALCTLGVAYYRALKRPSVIVEAPNPRAPRDRIVIVGRALYSFRGQLLPTRAVAEAVAFCSGSVKSTSSR